MPLGFIQVVVSINYLFLFITQQYFIIQKTSVYAPIEGCLDYFQLLAIMNRADINICVQSFSVNRSFHFSRVNAQECRITGSHGGNLIRNCQTSGVSLPLFIATSNGDFQQLCIFFSTWCGQYFLSSHSYRRLLAPVWILWGWGKEWALVFYELIIYSAESEVPWELKRCPWEQLFPNTTSRQLRVPVLVSSWPSFVIQRRMRRERIGTEREEASTEPSSLHHRPAFSRLLPFSSHFSLLPFPSVENQEGLRAALFNSSCYQNKILAKRNRNNQRTSVFSSRSLCHQL